MRTVIEFVTFLIVTCLLALILATLGLGMETMIRTALVLLDVTVFSILTAQLITLVQALRTGRRGALAKRPILFCSFSLAVGFLLTAIFIGPYPVIKSFAILWSLLGLSLYIALPMGLILFLLSGIFGGEQVGKNSLKLPVRRRRAGLKPAIRALRRRGCWASYRPLWRS
jgi:hypothetical protein